jgi:uncharacterized membrane protein (UPF0127 family)
MSHFLQSLLNEPLTTRVLRNERTGVLLATQIERAFDARQRRRGLLGRSGLASGTAIILAPCWAIHTCFMRFPIDVVFASRDGVVLKVVAGLRPWRMAVSWRAFAVIEMPFAAAGANGLRRGDRVGVVAG